MPEEVEWRTFVAEVIKSLAWPTTLLVLIAVFLEPLTELLSKLSGFRYKNVEVRFRQELRKSEELADRAKLPPPSPPPPRPVFAYSGPRELRFPEELRLLAYESPRDAVVDAWLRLEQAAADRITAEGIEAPKSGEKLIQLIEDNHLLGDDAVKLFRTLRVLRNNVVHDHYLWLSSQYADEFVLVAERLYAALRKGTEDKRNGGSPSRS